MKKSYIFITLVMLAGLLSCGRQDQKPSTEPIDRAPREELRAYHGAPPVIPHDVKASGRENCISCHQPGQQAQGRVVAPVTPHPDWGQCAQCHVERTVDTLFTENMLTALEEPTSVDMLTPFLPPYIPHRLDNDRDKSCETCHIGPQARTDLRPNHGPRTNCTQCHVPTYGPLDNLGTPSPPFTGPGQ